MEKIERVFKLHRILANRRTPIALPELLERLDCSKATVYRLIGFLRDRLAAPVHREEGQPGGFRYLPLPDGQPDSPFTAWYRLRCNDTSSVSTTTPDPGISTRSGVCARSASRTTGTTGTWMPGITNQ